MSMGSNPVQYPVLRDHRSEWLHSLNRDVFIVGRSRQASLVLDDPKCAWNQFVITRRPPRYYIRPGSEDSSTYVDGQLLSRELELRHGAVIQAHDTRFVFLTHDALPSGAGSGGKLPSQANTPEPRKKPLLASVDEGTEPGFSSGKFEMARESAITDPSPPDGIGAGGVPVERIALQPQLIVGRGNRADYKLSHPHVSRMHAQFTSTKDDAEVSDLNSANGTFVNGVRIVARTKIHPGDRIDIGPYAFEFEGRELVPRCRQDNVELACRNLCREVFQDVEENGRKTRKLVPILDDVSLVIRPRQFVCILGPSGSGKSTLLSALSARVPADRGIVAINGEDLYANFDALKGDIAVVPQRDVMHDLLVLKTALRYTARLRLPPDTSDAELDASIAEMLDTVELTNRADTRICKLSGGQIKRASLANEIISKPSLLFLDEVTSGLDEETDREMMELFREIADGGKTVVCITHTMAHVARTCDLVVVLTYGGKLAFVGHPADALVYFQVKQLGDIYALVKEQPSEDSKELAAKWKPAAKWQELFLNNFRYKERVTDLLPAQRSSDTIARPRQKPSWEKRRRLFSHQVRLLTCRFGEIQWADKRSLAITLTQCLLVAALISLLFHGRVKPGSATPVTSADRASGETLSFNDSSPVGGSLPTTPEELETHVETAIKAAEREGQKDRHATQIMFLLAVSCLWFGCNNAAKEIVKERTIYSRERDVNLLVPSYYASKVLLLGAITLAQTTLLLVVVKTLTEVEGGWFFQAFLLSATALAGVTLGLLISAVSTSNDMAVAIVPGVLIPQIILAGAIAKLHAWAKFLSVTSVTAYWSYSGLVREQLDGKDPDQLSHLCRSAPASAFVVCLHVLIFAGAALFWLMFVERRLAYGKALDRWVAAFSDASVKKSIQNRPG